MKATVYLNKDQLIRLAGIAATSKNSTIGISQEMDVDGFPINPACLATSVVKEGEQKAEIVTSMGLIQEL